MAFHAGLTSPFPRSEALVRATRDLDRGRTDPAAVEAAFANAEQTVRATERRLGFAGVTGGYLRTVDLFRIFAEGWEGFTVGPLTRWLESNTFFRQPILLHPPRRRAGAYAATLSPVLRAAPSEARLLLPGPYTFAETLDNRSGETGPALVHRLGRLLADELRELRGLGYRTFVLAEPLAVVRPPAGPTAASFEEAYRSIGAAAGDAVSLVWTYGADPRGAFPVLDRLPVTAVGFDLTETDVDRLPEPTGPRDVGLGVLDPRTTLVEEPEEVARVVRAVVSRRRARSVWLGPGAPLDLLPAEAAERKLEALARATARLAAGEGG